MPSPAIATVCPVLPVRDLTRAIDFYHRLGFTANRYKDGDTYAFIHRDGHEIHLRRSPNLAEEQNPASAYFYLIEGTAASSNPSSKPQAHTSPSLSPHVSGTCASSSSAIPTATSSSSEKA